MAPDGRAEIGYKIRGICSAVNTPPAPAVLLPAPCSSAPHTPSAHTSTSALHRCKCDHGDTPASPDSAP